MLHNLSRILMAEADASGGNGAVSNAPAPAVDVPQAQGDAVTMARADLDALVASAVEQGIAKAKDSIFAEARRTFTQSKNKPAPSANDAPAPQSAATPQVDPLKMRKLDRALNKAGLATRLTDSQYQRAEKAFASEDPDDAEAWVADYFNGFGAAPTPTPAPTAAPAAPAPSPSAQPLNPHPVSDRGSPPPSRVPLHEADLWTMSESDRAALIREKGIAWYTAKLKEQGKGRSIRLR